MFLHQFLCLPIITSQGLAAFFNVIIFTVFAWFFTNVTQVWHVSTGSCTAKLRFIGILTEMCRQITGASRAQCVTYLADLRCQNPWAKRTKGLPYARRNCARRRRLCATSANIRVSTGQRVHDPELKRDTVSCEIRRPNWCGQETLWSSLEFCSWSHCLRGHELIHRR